MKKNIILLLILFIILLSVNCSVVDESEMKLMPSQTNYAGAIENNTPEALAKKSSQIYKGMISEEISINEGYILLTEMAAEQSKAILLESQEQFEKQVTNTIDYLRNQRDAIETFVFAETEYKDDKTASIKRIQIHENGKKYYFVQDFVLENGEWKIKGDNVENKFSIKRKILLWYF